MPIAYTRAVSPALADCQLTHLEREPLDVAGAQTEHAVYDSVLELPFDAESARMYGLVFAAASAAGQSSRARLADLLIASTAAADGLPLYRQDLARQARSRPYSHSIVAGGLPLMS